MSKKLPLLLIILAIILSLSYCTLWVAGYSHIEQIEDDEHVGKTLLIYPSAGQFVPDKSWYFGKRTGDSYLSSQRAVRDSKIPPVLYTIVGKYRTVNHGGNLLSGPGSKDYIVEPVGGKIDKRLFFFSLPRCEEQTDLFDQDTNIKIDFVCD
jgi:hypothetical protein